MLKLNYTQDIQLYNNPITLPQVCDILKAKNIDFLKFNLWYIAYRDHFWNFKVYCWSHSLLKKLKLQRNINFPILVGDAKSLAFLENKKKLIW